MWAHQRRITDTGGAIAELKTEHGLDHARCRGTSLFHVHLLPGCTALNLKRVTTRGEAAEGEAAGPNTGQTAAPEAHSTPIEATSARQPGRHTPIATPPAAVLAAPNSLEGHCLTELTEVGTGFLDTPRPNSLYAR